MRLVRFGSPLLALLAGCHSSRPGQPAGSDLAVTSNRSVALPGATDAADAPHAPQISEPRTAADLATFRDPDTGISFQYPSVWRPAVAGQSPIRSEFESVAGKARMTQEFLPEGTYYESTVLRALRFSYTVRRGLDVARCAALAKRVLPNATGASTPTYNGVTFTEVAGSDAGMCTHVETRVDTVSQQHQCFIFERDFVTGCPFVKTTTTPRPLTPKEIDALQRHLDGVMQSVRLETR